MERLLTEMRQFVVKPKPAAHWRWLTGPDGQLPCRLRQAVRHGLSPAGLRHLDVCVELAGDDRFRDRIADCHSDRAEAVSAHRLRHNIQGLLLAARVAVLVNHFSADESSPDQLARSLSALARCLHPEGQPNQELEPFAPRLMELHPGVLLRTAFDRMAQAGWRAAAARLWAEYWLGDVCRAGGDAPRRESLCVPFAAYVKSQGDGLLAWLRLDRLADGSLAEHPAHALRPIARDWLETLLGAWEQAGRPPACWDVYPHGPEAGLLLPFGGTSAGGAMGVAFRLLREGIACDRHCLVVAGLRPDGTLEGVGREYEKIQAALAEARFTRALMARGTGGRKTELTVQQEETFIRNGLKVERCATLGEAAHCASALATGLRAYLRDQTGLSGLAQPPYLGRDRHLADLYLQPDVLKEHARAVASGDSPRPRAQTLAEEDSQRFGREERRERVPWKRECRRLRRVVILGRPGEGKTLLARMTARDLASKALTELDQGGGLHEVNIPIYLCLDDVVLQGSLESAVRHALRRYPAEVADFLWRSLGTECGCLFLDGLDEVRDRATLHRALADLPGECKVVVTSRPLGYGRQELPFTITAEYELASLTGQQRRRFVERWFDDDSARRERLLQLLQANPQLGDLTRNPLLLTLTCWTAERHSLPEQTRRVDLYRRIVPDLVRQVWRESPRPASDPAVGTLLRVLERTAWDLFSEQPQRTRLMERELQDSIIAALAALRSRLSLEEVLGQLQDCGLLLYLDDQDRVFLHRTFLEYLAAEHVAHQPSPIAAIERFLWQPNAAGGESWQPAAMEMLCFLAGCLDRPEPLLQRLVQLDEQKRDLGRTMLLLAGRCLADTDETKVAAGWLQKIVAEVHEVWRNPPKGVDPNDALLALTSTAGRNRLLEEMVAEGRLHSDRAAVALAELGDGRILEVLLEAIHTVRDASVVSNLYKAIATLGDHRATTSLIEAVTQQNTMPFGFSPGDALGMLNDDTALAALLDAARDPVPAVRANALTALGMMQSRDVEQPLLEALHDPEPRIRETAVVALATVGTDTATAALREQMRMDAELHVRLSAAWSLGISDDLSAEDDLVAQARLGLGGAVAALGELRTPRSISVLLDLLAREESRAVWLDVVQALADAGEPRVESILLQTLVEKSHIGRCVVAAQCLGRLGSKRAVPSLRAFLEGDEDARLRAVAAHALGELGVEEAVEALCARLSDSDERVRTSAARALNAIARRTGRWIP